MPVDSSTRRPPRSRADRSVELQGGLFGFALGDVAGKGPPAALLSAMLQGVFAAQVDGTESPAETVTRVNHALYKRAIENRFVTLLYGVLFPDGRLTYCNAGHNPPILLSGDKVRRLEAGGPIVGLFELIPFEQETITLTPGDWVIVFSDGVSEALSATGDEFGDPRIIDCVRKYQNDDPRVLVERLFSAVREFTAGAPQSDDVTALVVRYKG
jgi:sigma-B regulation protein RsbU (phosphoserine phosphatase)